MTARTMFPQSRCGRHAIAFCRYALGEDFINLFERLRKQAGWIQQMMMPTIKIIMRQTLEVGTALSCSFVLTLRLPPWAAVRAMHTVHSK